MNINYYMDLAIQEANKSYLLNEVPVGAVLVDNIDNSVICKSHNQMIKMKNSIMHAEINLIYNACKKMKSKYLTDTSIFITLEPCAMCAAAISEVRIAKIYFGAYDDKKGSVESAMNIFSNKNYFFPETYGGIRELQCGNILKKFFEKKRNNHV